MGFQLNPTASELPKPVLFDFIRRKFRDQRTIRPAANQCNYNDANRNYYSLRSDKFPPDKL